jgi:glycerol-3-phosphate dehydrogenase
MIIIGGGIYGVILFLEASKRGLRAALLEKDDFGAATTFNNFRILHGGLRYLQGLDLYRFRESVKERRWFLKTFPELVTPLAFLMPLYGFGVRRPRLFRAALYVNAALSWDRNNQIPDNRRLGAGTVVGPAETQRLFPNVNVHNLKGSAIWYDAFMADPHRIVIEALRWACQFGATALNYFEVVDLCKVGSKVSGVAAIDRISSRTYELTAKIVINAAGPWSRELSRMFDRDIRKLFVSSLAWNVLIDHKPISDHALAITSPTDNAHTYFILPCKNKLLVGTGHAPLEGIFANPQPSPAQLQEMLSDINGEVGGLNIGMKDIVRVYSGQLPVKTSGSIKLTSREVIIDHGKHGGISGLYSISGVKFTTARAVAEKLLNYVCNREYLALQGRPVSKQCSRPNPNRYMLDEKNSVKEDDCKEIVTKLVQGESVQHLDDLLFRRLNLADDPERALSLAPIAAGWCGWDGDRIRDELDRLGKKIEHLYPRYRVSSSCTAGVRC